MSRRRPYSTTFEATDFAVPSDVDAVFVMGHGTRSTKGRQQFLDAVQSLSDAIRPTVAAGFIELCGPNMYEAIDALLATRPRHLVIAPMVLLPAGHLKDDGAELTRYVRKVSPATVVNYAHELGIHGALINAVADSSVALGLNEGDAVLLVGRGSTDPDANSDLYKVGRLLSETLGESHPVEVSFISLAKPSVSQGLAKLSALGATRVVIQPYFLYTGALLDRIHQEAQDWAKLQQSNFDIAFALEIGEDPRVQRVLLERIVEAAGAPIRMSCDLCIYRSSSNETKAN